MSEVSHTKVLNETDGVPSKPKKRDRSASEEKLMNAGLEIFSKHGFDGATTKMIAKKADVNESLIGRYFEGKSGLLVAIVTKFIEEMSQLSLPYPPQTNLADELSEYVKFRLHNGCIREEFARIIFVQSLVDKKFKKQLRESVTLQLDPNLVERVQRLSDLKKLKPGTDVQRLCQHVDTYLDGVFFFDRILIEEKQEVMLADTKDFVRTYAKLFDV
ncbi:TetR/AcrR family transcriptional regulator [Bdellovibrio bacteriovorus]